MSTQQTNKPGANKKRARESQSREERRRASLREILAHGLTRRYIWELLELTEPVGDPRMYDGAGNYDTHASAGQAAVKALGAQILGDIMVVNPEAYLTYHAERKSLGKEAVIDEDE